MWKNSNRNSGSLNFYGGVLGLDGVSLMQLEVDLSSSLTSVVSSGSNLFSFRWESYWYI
jgi:hypothetical protein